MNDLIERLRDKNLIHYGKPVRDLCAEAADALSAPTSAEVQRDEFEKYFILRTHACSGRDCVGYLREPTGSLPRCEDCAEITRIRAMGDE